MHWKASSPAWLPSPIPTTPVNNPVRLRTGKEFTAAFQVAGIWGNVRYFSPLVAFKTYRSMHYLKFNSNGHNVLAFKSQLGYIQGYGGDVAPPNNRFYAGGDSELRGFDIRSATPYGYVPTRQTVQLTNPDNSCVPRDPNNPQLNQCIAVPIPVYGIVSIGGDTSFLSNLEYRIPIVGSAMFSLFDDFGPGRRRQPRLKAQAESRRLASLTAPLYGCPVYNNGSCQGGILRFGGWIPADIRPVACTNVVPRMSLGGEFSIIMPVINAPSAFTTRLQPAPSLRTSLLQRREHRSEGAELHGRVDYPRYVPPGWRRRLYPTSRPSRPTAPRISSANRARPFVSAARPPSNLQSLTSICQGRSAPSGLLVSAPLVPDSLFPCSLLFDPLSAPHIIVASSC